MKLSYIPLAGTMAVALGVYVIFNAWDGSPAGAGAVPTSGKLALSRAAADQASPARNVMVPSKVSARDWGTRESAAEIADLRAEVTRLGAAVSALQQQLRAPPPRGAQPSEEGEEIPGHDPRTELMVDAKEEQRRQEQIEAIEFAFWQEPDDRQWSEGTAAEVQAALASIETTPMAVQSLVCRSRTCRLEIADDHSGTLDKSIPTLVQKLAPVLPSITFGQARADDGTTTTVLYLSRDADQPPPDDAAFDN